MQHFKKRKNPTDFLKQIFGKLVQVKLHNGSQFIGILASLDGNMNIVLEKAEEFEGEELRNKYGMVYLRGNNVYYISSKPNIQKKDEIEDV